MKPATATACLLYTSDWLRKRPYTLLFLDGSHENYDLLKQYPTEERFGGKVQALDVYKRQMVISRA